MLADRVEQLYSQMWLGILMTFAIGAIATFELWEQRLKELVLFWWCIVLVHHRLERRPGPRVPARRRPAPTQPDQWLRWLGIAALANGANWGFAGAVFFPSHADEQQVFLAFLLAGMMSAGIPVYAASWPIFAVYAAGIVAPFTYVLATFGNRLFTEIAAAGADVLRHQRGDRLPAERRVPLRLPAAPRLRQADRRLQRAQPALERQLVELEEARRQVEASGRKLALFAERAPIAVLELDPQGRSPRSTTPPSCSSATPRPSWSAAR